MVYTILKIRIHQLFRSLSGLGIVRFVFLAATIAFFAFIIFRSALLHTNVLLGAAAVIFAAIHLQRKDQVFQKTVFRNPAIIRFVEYLTLSIPLIISLLWHQKFIETPAWIIFIFILSMLPLALTKKSYGLRFLTELIPSGNFEWQSGARKTGILLIALYSIGLAASFLSAGIPVIIVIISIIPLSFYDYGEPVNILIAPGFLPNKLLIKKISSALKIYNIAMLPLLFLYVVFHSQLWYIPVIELLVFNIILTYSILLKYAFYMPNEKNTAAQLFVSFGFLSIFIPVLLPLIVILCVYFYIRAERNLGEYLTT